MVWQELGGTGRGGSDERQFQRLVKKTIYLETGVEIFIQAEGKQTSLRLVKTNCYVVKDQ